MNFSGNDKPIVACVKNNEHCENIIANARRIADNKKGPLKILCTLDEDIPQEEKDKFSDLLFRLSRNYNAELQLYFTGKPILNAFEYISSISPRQIVTGLPENGYLMGFVGVLHSVFPEIPLSMIAKQNTVHNIFPSTIGMMSTQKANL